MIGLIYLGSWRESDSGIFNMSGLDTYVSGLFWEFGIELPRSDNQLPASYGDDIFIQLATTIAWYCDELFGQCAINTMMILVRQSNKHVFASHYNCFKRFHRPKKSLLLVNGVHVKMVIFNSFFLLNCYICMNELSNSFNI